MPVRRFGGLTIDLLLPDMSGWGLLRTLRDENLAPDMPIVVVSTVRPKVAAGGIVPREALAKPI
jgi:CheY-like chemotaxis protein